MFISELQNNQSVSDRLYVQWPSHSQSLFVKVSVSIIKDCWSSNDREV